MNTDLKHYDRYAMQMASQGRGLAIWEPQPDKTYTRVEIGDVGYMLNGHFLRLFNAILPPRDGRNKLGEPEGYQPLCMDGDITLLESLPAREPVWSSGVKVVGAHIEFSAQMPVAGPGASIQAKIMTSSGNGAMLITGHEMVSEDTALDGIFQGYIKKYHRSWVTFAKKLGRIVKQEDLILVTGRHVTEDFAMFTFSEASRDVEIELDIGIPSIGSGHAAFSVRSRHITSPHTNYGPRTTTSPDSHLFGNQLQVSQSDTEKCTQCVFVRGYRVKNSFPVKLKAAAGPHVLGYEGREREYEPLRAEDSEGSSDDVELISDTTPMIDPTHPLLDYILKNSDASLAIVHDSDLAWVYRHNHIGSQEDLGEALDRITPDLEITDGVGRFKYTFAKHINAQGRQWSDGTAPSVTAERGDTVKAELLHDNGADGNLDTQSSFTLRKRAATVDSPPDTLQSPPPSQILSVAETDISTSMRNVRVLSLDGGGFRGLSSLILLRNLMERITVKGHASAAIRPSAYFDLIIGTGTGGLSALFLGRMRMTVDEAINAYLRVCEQGFERSPIPLLQRLQRKEALFDGDSVTRVIGDIVQKFVGDRDAQLQDSPGIIGTGPDFCRTAVLATSSAHAFAPPFVFRSYPTRIDLASTYSIHQAARATIATAGAFPPISIGSPPIAFSDAGVADYTNPAEVALHEVTRIWPGAKITCLVSLGTGLQNIVRVGDTSADVTQVARRIMEDCEKVHDRLLQRSHHDRLPYYRFNVNTGLDAADIREWDEETSGVITSITEGYARKLDVDMSLNSCASILTGNTIANSISREDYDPRSFATIKDDALAKEISAWLKAPDSSISYKDARIKHQEGTGAWFMDGKPFSKWKEDTASFLCVYGKPGCGKTVLCSSIISHVKNMCQEKKLSAYAYFFFDGRNGQKEFQLLDGLIRSLIQQFVHQCDGIPSLLVELFEKRHWLPSTDALGDLLLHILRGFTHAYIIIDSLDECVDKWQLLNWVKKMAVSKISNLHMVVTSRPEEKIKSAIQSFERPSISMDADLVNHDIHAYIDSIIRKGQLEWWPGTVQSHIKNTLMERAQGMFRWLAMQLEEVENCLDEAELNERLGHLPKDLGETYHRILTNIPEQRRTSVRVFLQWTAFSTRPPTLEELMEAGAMEFDRESVPKYNPRRKFRPRNVLIACGGLVTETYGRIQLAHFSVKEYLMSDGITNGAVQYFRISEKLSHSIIAKTSVAYLLSLDSLGPLEDNTLATAPLAEYAASNWVFHAHSGGGDGEHAMTKLIVALLESKNPLVNWIRIWDPENVWRGMQSLILSTEIAEPLYYASLFGFTAVSQHLLDNGANPNSRRPVGDRALEKGAYVRYGNALQAASHEGHLELVDLLLNAGAAVNVLGGKYGCALQAACHKGHLEVVKLLLDFGADVNMRGGKYGCALQAACHKGHLEVVKLLLDFGADVNMLGENFRDTALQAALFNRHKDVIEAVIDIDQETVKLPLEKGMDGRFVGSPLLVASFYGHMELVELLLANFADVNQQGGIFGTPLQAACFAGHKEIFKLLLANNADINAEGGLFGNALMTASINGHEDIVKLLLDNHADVNARTTLQFGLFRKETDAFTLSELFYKKEAHVDAEELVTYALQIASSKGFTNIVKTLLDYGADVNARGGDHRNALQAALDKGHYDIVKLLLEYGATPPPDFQQEND